MTATQQMLAVITITVIIVINDSQSWTPLVCTMLVVKGGQADAPLTQDEDYPWELLVRINT